ncbi:lysine-specific demethylase 4A isoform X2 [Dunckerocampus dactyliophorus]|uniref:lysine-specific demethylase 4A isoform X2 n=1 Tax=Dunckerocampus dactyliophorus TaxID=161453 RepID=UPI002404EAF5|nr:lysine-specific demethylase 4A isoform X2 [Dunckerocampus dactyliophorus]
MSKKASTMSTDSAAQSGACRIMTFSPSSEEFKDFSRYIAYMESQGAHKAGMAKVIPPKGWRPRKTYDDIDDLVIPAPIQQVVTGQSGLFTQYNIQKKPMTVDEFRKTSNMDKFCNPRYVDFDELERKFWKNLTFNPPLYGADVSGSLYDPDVTEWNIGRLDTILDTVEHESGIKIKGVNTPYLYFGMWKSAFAWHTEDMDLYSINFLHFGEPKSWYAVPPEHGRRLERLAKGFFPGNAQSCEAFLRHKMTLISPSILKKYGIPFEKVTQEAGQFIVTFPFGYHAGFNHGFNCAESTNFATQRWIDYGKQATLCSCRQDMVKISMDVFVRKFQPERYKLWKAGKDNAPIDHSKPTPEAAEFLKDQSVTPKESPLDIIFDHTANPAQENSSPKLQRGTKRALEATEDIKADLDAEEAEPKKVKLTTMESPAQVMTDTHAVKVESQPQEEGEEDQSSIKQTPARQESQTSNKNDMPPSDPVEGQVVALCTVQPTGSGEEAEVGTGLAHKVFQRTLSPADVLHVHSYAKGDYAEDEAPPKEEKGEEEKKEEKDSSENIIEEKKGVIRQGTKVARCTTEESDLGQLPGHHPLIKDGVSDEEATEEASPMEEGGLEGEGWAKPLAHLWQSRPPNMKKEKEYNQRMGSKPPYCSICALFLTYQQTERVSGTNAPIMAGGGRMRTKPLIPETCFATTTEEDAECEEPPLTPHLEEDGTSLLISCSQCSVRVHTSCYGINPARVSKEWKCARCKANAMMEVKQHDVTTHNNELLFVLPEGRSFAEGQQQQVGACAVRGGRAGGSLCQHH